MPKKSKTNLKKIVERSRRRQEYKMYKGGNQLNIFDTEPSQLTNEQKFINDLYNEYSKYNSVSLINLAKAQYNEQHALNVVEELNKTQTWKTWIQGYFDSLWKCLRIFDLKYFYTDYIKTELEHLSVSVDKLDSDKPDITLELAYSYLNKLIKKYIDSNIDLQLLIYTCITLYTQNKPCKLHTAGKKKQFGGNLVGGIVLILIILGIFFTPSSESSKKKKEKEVETEPEQEEEESLVKMIADDIIDYKIYNRLKKGYWE